MSRVYLSGPITGDGQHRERFAGAEALVRARGDEPVNPLDVPAMCEDFSCLKATDHGPHSNTPEGKHTWACYLRGDVCAMLSCDSVLLLKGWEKSPGAMAEQFIARMLRMPVEELS